MGRGERRHVVEPEALEHRDGGKPGERQRRRVLAEEVGDVEIRDEEADAGDEGELGRAHQAREDARRHLAALCSCRWAVPWRERHRRPAARPVPLRARPTRQSRPAADDAARRRRGCPTWPRRVLLACGIALSPVSIWLLNGCSSRSRAKPAGGFSASTCSLSFERIGRGRAKCVQPSPGGEIAIQLLNLNSICRTQVSRLKPPCSLRRPSPRSIRSPARHGPHHRAFHRRRGQHARANLCRSLSTRNGKRYTAASTPLQHHLQGADICPAGQLTRGRLSVPTSSRRQCL